MIVMLNEKDYQFKMLQEPEIILRELSKDSEG